MQPRCDQGNLQLGSFSFHPFEKNIPLPLCVACNVPNNVVKIMRILAKKQKPRVTTIPVSSWLLQWQPSKQPSK
jgi:hypothetical protein